MCRRERKLCTEENNEEVEKSNENDKCDLTTEETYALNILRSKISKTDEKIRYNRTCENDFNFSNRLDIHEYTRIVSNTRSKKIP